MRPRPGSPVLATVLVLLAAFLTPAAAAADGNHPPGMPTRLTVNDLVAPLAVDGTPRFGWLPQDRDRNEAQTAYQVVVTGASGVVWDSGKVGSARQSWVAGPALDPGATYRWTVRTWDSRGVPSPYARPASFDTALADWSGAAWIRRPATGNDAANEWTLARKVLPVGRGKIVRARAYVSATSDWELTVNGVAAGRGTSYGYPGEGYYDVTALTNLRPGEPAVIGVRYHYWTCRCQGRANGPQSPEGPSGLLAKIVVDHADGTRETTVSDGSWRLTKDTAQDITTLTYRNSDAGDRVEYVDATKEITGWHSPVFDDSTWTAATVVGAHPRPNPPNCTGYGSSPCAFTHLRPQQAHLRHETIHPVSVRRLPDGTVFADFGKVVAAVPRVTFRDGTAGHAVTMTTSYRRNNSTLTAAIAPGASTVPLAAVGNVHPGDEITVDAPANGYGPGDPETRAVVAVDPQGTVELDRPLRRAHDTGAWVENSRAGTSRLDTQGSDMRFHYTQKAGEQVAEPFTYWGWRYLEISDPGEHLSTRDIAAVTQATDVAPAEAATFSSDNETLNAVFDLMRHSALYSAQNVFLDTPTREKGQFLGDTIDQSFATMESLNERALTRQAIVEFMGSQDRFWPNGGMNAVYPNGDGKRDIPDYTEMFPEWVMRYHQLTGDDDLVRLALPAMRRVADYISAAVDGTGLVTNLPGGSGAYANGIIDWPAPMRYDSVVTGNASRTVVNALAIGAFHAVADGASAVGDPVTAAEYRQRAAALTAAMNSRLLDPATGRYADGLTADGQRIANASQHAQSFPVAYGVAPDPAGLAGYIGGLGMRQGPMTLRQLLSAVPPETVLRLLTDATGEGPAQVLAEGGTFLWEQWRPGCPAAPCLGTQVDQGSSESFSHGWGAAGISAIIESLLGLRVSGQGAETLTIAPPATGLDHAGGTVWTQRGPVTVAWRHTGDRFSLDVTLPVNVTATVVLPDGAEFTAGSGRSHFQS